ncbi:unnamed protein product [Leptidea sinapis]|uniref:Uncharacterized protein n=1 Tax=Leptidea sinapis TaxID=189913 RepID=A0A5E4PQ11_9NEOP|nr:unnamed protein product [Leptidea sinapis]
MYSDKCEYRPYRINDFFRKLFPVFDINQTYNADTNSRETKRRNERTLPKKWFVIDATENSQSWEITRYGIFTPSCGMTF